MSPVISKRTAKAAISALSGEFPGHGGDWEKAAEEIRKAVAPKKFVKAAKVRKWVKRAIKRDETAAIRETVRARAEGGCELCPDLGAELHHALGRRVRQGAENCLWLCRNCHRAITVNRPSAAYWLEAQGAKFNSLGHSDTAVALFNRRDFVLARGAA